MFRLNIFPANDGDCLLLDYGVEQPYRHILIDGGRRGAYAKLRPELMRLAASGEKIDLLVLTHIDADHIEGLLALISDENLPVDVEQIWYNGYDQLSLLEPYGPQQGDDFSELIRNKKWRWNASFDGGPVVVDGSKPRTIELPGGLRLTLLSPTPEGLGRLHAEWTKWRFTQEKSAATPEPDVPEGLEAYGRREIRLPLNIEELAAAETKVDTETPNGSSIAMIAEFDGKRIVLAGDAHPDVLAKSLAELGGDKPYPCDIFKVSHHGSRANTTTDLVGRLDCRRFVISTSGARHGHPDPEAIARLIKHGSSGMKTLYFNYAVDETTIWSNPDLMRDFSYECKFATYENEPLRIDV